MSLLTTPAGAGATAAESVRAALQRRQRDVAGWTMLLTLLLTSFLTLAILTALLVQVVGESGPLLAERRFDFVTRPIGSDPDKMGIWSGLYGTIVIGVIVLLVAIPMGIAAAIYLEEYARPTNPLTKVILINIRNLAGVPAVIYGVLGFIIFTQWLDPITQGKTALAAGLTMAVLVLPIVVITRWRRSEQCRRACATPGSASGHRGGK
jgi:phosphate transport system permease protein